MKVTVVLLPGFNGSAEQPLLLRVERALLEALPGLTCLRLAPPRLKVAPDLAAHLAWLEAALAPLRPPLIVIGRSFGGRLAVRLAARRALAGVGLLGFPVRPPGKRRPLDEAALREVRCPTLIIQGSKDELGPLRVLKPLVANRASVTLHVLEGAGHSFGRLEGRAVEQVTAWVAALV